MFRWMHFYMHYVEVFSTHWSSRNEKWKLRIIDCHPYFSHYLPLVSFMSYQLHVPFVFISMSYRNLSLFSFSAVVVHLLVLATAAAAVSIFFCFFRFLVSVFLLLLIISNVSVYIHSFAIYHLVAVGIPLKSYTIHMRISMRIAFKTFEWKSFQYFYTKWEAIFLTMAHRKTSG